jgi:hypothetical protein
MPIFRISGELKFPFDYDDVYAEDEDEADQLAYERACDTLFEVGLDVEVDFFSNEILDEDD